MDVSKKNVILVEREKDSLLSVSLILKFNGYNVTVCKSLNEAWDNILALEKESSFCALLMTDIPVSRLTDEDVLNKRNRLTRTFPIYIITDYADKKMRLEYEKKDFFLIEKPVEPQDLLKYINKTFKKKGGFNEKSMEV